MESFVKHAEFKTKGMVLLTKDPKSSNEAHFEQIFAAIQKASSKPKV